MILRRFAAFLVCLFVFIGTSCAQTTDEASQDATVVKAWESFSYPLDVFVNPPNTASDPINGATGGVNVDDANGDGGWFSPWILEATSYEAVLSETQIDTERIAHQDPFIFTGSYSLEIRTPAINGPKRSFPTVTHGELWVSFLYRDTGPETDHDSGLFILDATGTKLFLLGKPRDSGMLGISHLPDGIEDSLSEIDYSEPHHLMARIVIDEASGVNDDVYLWIDPDESDRLDTYNAGGEDNAEIDSMGWIMASRRQNAGSGFFDDITVTTMPSLPPAGTVRVDLGFDPSSRVRANGDIVLHDVISIDSFTDGYTGPGYGHGMDQNYFMVVRGYIYYDNEGASRVARGVPIDRMSGLSGFSVGRFNDSLEDVDTTSGWKNAVRFAPETGTETAVSFGIPEGNYGQCRVLTSGDGYGTLDAVFEYEDGSEQSATLRSPDWLDDPVDDNHGGVIPGDIVSINNGMNRLDDYSYFEGSTPISGENPQLDDASFFVNRVALDQTKTLVGLKLGPSSGSVVNVYDLLLDADSDATAVVDWMTF